MAQGFERAAHESSQTGARDERKTLAEDEEAEENDGEDREESREEGPDRYEVRHQSFAVMVAERSARNAGTKAKCRRLSCRTSSSTSRRRSE